MNYITQPFIGPFTFHQLKRIKAKLLKMHDEHVWQHKHEIVLQDIIEEYQSNMREVSI